MAKSAGPAGAYKICAGCRTVNEATAWFCHSCGLALPSLSVSAGHAFGNPAGLRLRLVAGLIDLAAVFGVWMAAYAAMTGVAPATLSDGDALLQQPGLLLGGWALLAPYFVIPTALWGRTLGKLVMGLKAVRGDGSRVSMGRSLGRYLAYYLSIAPGGLGFAAVALGPRALGWHDMLCDTQVLRARQQ